MTLEIVSALAKALGLNVAHTCICDPCFFALPLPTNSVHSFSYDRIPGLVGPEASLSLPENFSYFLSDSLYLTLALRGNLKLLFLIFCMSCR